MNATAPKIRRNCSACAARHTISRSKWSLQNYLKSFSLNLSYIFRFYICCDKCQDWFHGKCVGILQSEADFIDEYICPNCQKNNSIDFKNMKTLSENNFNDLFDFLKEIQVSGSREIEIKTYFGCLQSHKSAWPFIDPVDVSEVLDYYNVVTEPMGKFSSSLLKKLTFLTFKFLQISNKLNRKF